jgi:hypothetical protein
MGFIDTEDSARGGALYHLSLMMEIGAVIRGCSTRVFSLLLEV